MADRRMITKLSSSYYYTACKDTLGAQMVYLSSFTKQVGNFDSRKVNNTVCHPSFGSRLGWPPPRLYEAERQFNGRLITNNSSGIRTDSY